LLVIPAKAGIQRLYRNWGRHWIPAFAGMTSEPFLALIELREDGARIVNKARPN